LRSRHVVIDDLRSRHLFVDDFRFWRGHMHSLVDNLWLWLWLWLWPLNDDLRLWTS
jgi:hypothetical protein